MCLSYFFTITILVSFDVQAADWTSIKKTKDYELIVDMDSYNESAGLPFITTKTIFYGTQKSGFKGKPFLYIEELSTNQFNCKLHTYKTLTTHFYQLKHKLVASKDGMQKFEALEKGSNNALISTLVCQVHQMVGGQ